MTEEPFSERLKRLEDRIAAARAGRAEQPSAHRGEFTQGTVAWRMVTELVIGMALGVGLRAPHGGVFVLFAVQNILGFLIALIAGVVVAALAVTAAKQLGANRPAAVAA